MARNSLNRDGQRDSIKATQPAKRGRANAKLNKHERMIALLRQPAGASLASLVKTTGWQPHSVRGAISAILRKRMGLNVVSLPGKHGVRVYRIVTQGKRGHGKPVGRG